MLIRPGNLMGPQKRVLIPPTYFSLAGITNPTEIAAVNTLVATMQSDGTWDLCDRIHPMSPTSLNAATYCVKTLKQLTWFGTPTCTSTGVVLDGATQYAFSDLNLPGYPIYTASINSGHVGAYITAYGALTGTQYVWGVAQSTESGAYDSLLRQNATVINAILKGTTSANQTASLNAAYQCVTRNTTLFRYRNKVSVATSAVASGVIDFANRQFALGALNNNGVASGFMPMTCAFWHWGSGLNATNEGKIYDAIQAYQTSLSRNV